MIRHSAGKLVALTAILGLAGPLAVWSAQQTGAALADDPQTISSPRPLLDLCELIQSWYAKIVTYEDPIWVWRGELESRRGNENVKWGLFPKARTFSIPASLSPATAPTLSLQLLDSFVDLYHRQTDGPRFTVLSSKLGLHIVPTQAYDATGRLTPAVNPLDLVVSVPVASRTPSGHLRALCAQLSASSPVPIEFDASGMVPWLDQFFAPPQAEFDWGAAPAVAREALIDLLDRSATSLCWKLLCQASAEPGDRLCMLNIRPVQVSVTRPDGETRVVSLQYDRCTKCPPLPPPPIKK
ncbi:MAG: hypothetical protein ABSB88_07595 [Bryobacteraceae bacterium]